MSMFIKILSPLWWLATAGLVLWHPEIFSTIAISWLCIEQAFTEFRKLND